MISALLRRTLLVAIALAFLHGPRVRCDAERLVVPVEVRDGVLDIAVRSQATEVEIRGIALRVVDGGN